MYRIIPMHLQLFFLIIMCSTCCLTSEEVACPYSIYPDYRVNLSQVKFETFDAWVDGMCAQCYNYLGFEDNAWKLESLHKYLMEYMYVKYPTRNNPDTTKICFYNNSTQKLHQECFDFKYEYLNRSEPSVFISQLNGKRYVVCTECY